MASTAFSSGECEYLAALDDPSELRSRFYDFWTLKEAFAKALCLTLVDALGQCRMIDAAGARRVQVPTPRHWRALVFAPRPQLRLAVVRVCESSEQVRAALRTVEWPAPRIGEWPVVLDLDSADGRGAGAW
jgi:phosphopantetheinyl transferase